MRESCTRNQRGQAVLMGILMAGVLTMAMLATFNVGQTITAKMKLQDEVDAAAYSTALWEARAFNYYAYTNRAMIANFVSMIWLAGLESNAEAWDDLCWECCTAIPFGVGAACSALNTATEAYHNAVESVVETMIPPDGDGPFDYLIRYVLSPAQQAMQIAMLAHLASAPGQIFDRMDLSDSKAEMLWTFSLYNESEFLRVQKYEANADHLRDGINASRDAFSEGKVFPRGWSVGVEVGPVCGKIFGEASGSVKRQTLSEDCTPTNPCYKVKTRDEIGIKGPGMCGGFLGIGSYPCCKTLYSATGEYVHSINYIRDMQYMQHTGDDPPEPSVLIAAKKDLRQFFLSEAFGLADGAGDLYAIARSKATYRDPINPGRAPNFWNPFWDAKLDPIDNTWVVAGMLAAGGGPWSTLPGLSH